MAARNCWEFKKCGREPGGPNVSALGVCPAAVERRVDGLNHGKNGGRACWALTGTLCGGVVQGTFAMKLSSCLQCEFYKVVAEEEGGGFLTDWVGLRQAAAVGRGGRWRLPDLFEDIGSTRLREGAGGGGNRPARYR